MAGLAIAYCVPGVDERWQNAGSRMGKKANFLAAGRTGIARKRCGCFSLKARAVIQIDEEEQRNGGEFPLVELPMPPREEEAPASSSPGRSITVSSSVTDSEDSSDRFVIRNNREIYQEKAFLVGVEMKRHRALFSIDESLKELQQLADTAGLAVVGSTYQKLGYPNPRTYMASGKVAEVKTAVQALDVETVILDDEISPGQLRNLEKAFGDDIRVCDRTALILDIFSQRAATREAALQVELAQLEYQLPRLTKLWTHLERQAGGMVKGMGEKQIEVDKRILRTKIAELRKNLESVRDHRQQYRNRRASVPIPVISLVGYTNAGKSTLLNKLSNAGVLAEDKLFATLDPITRRVQLPNGKECLFTDTVGFIQKLPTQLVAAFRATLEEISDSSLILHVVDRSHSMAPEQTKAVDEVLAELDVQHIPRLSVWNKIDKAEDPDALRAEAKQQGAICVSALTGEGIQEFFDAVETKLKDLLVRVEAIVPYSKGDLVDMIHRRGVVEHEEYTDSGTLVRAHVPLALSKQLLEYRDQMLQTLHFKSRALGKRSDGFRSRYSLLPFRKAACQRFSDYAGAAHVYRRYGSPNTKEVGDAIAALEGGESAISKLYKKYGCVLVVDNTFGTPVQLKPLKQLSLD